MSSRANALLYTFSIVVVHVMLVVTMLWAADMHRISSQILLNYAGSLDAHR